MSHPHQALKQADGAAEAAEQVAGQSEFQRQDRSGDADEQRLAASVPGWPPYTETSAIAGLVDSL